MKSDQNGRLQLLSTEETKIEKENKCLAVDSLFIAAPTVCVGSLFCPGFVMLY